MTVYLDGPWPACSRTPDCGNDSFGPYHGPTCQRSKHIQGLLLQIQAEQGET